MDLKKLLEGVERAARHAGKIMLEARNVGNTVSEKEGHANFVTEYDKRVQEYLFREMMRLLPGARMVGEEEGADAFSDLDGYAFCIDPIDGTLNFIAGYFPSVTSIALLEDGRPLLGVVYNPYADEMFSAIRGGGAWRNGHAIVSSEAPLARSLTLFGTAPYNPELNQITGDLCVEYLSRSEDLRRSGSAAWDLCCVACGQAGLFYEVNLHLWDYAAAGLICEEAGCVLSDMRGAPLRFDVVTSSVIVASRGVSAEDYLPRKPFEI